MTAAARSDENQDLNGPVAQSVRIGFLALRAATLVLALYWAVSNIHQVPPDTQAAVLRFGQVSRIQQSGLVAALPRPFERVELLPGPLRQITLRVDAGVPYGPAIVDPASRANGEMPPETAGVYLTGDGGVVLLDAALTYQIVDPAAYYLARDHVPAALRRLFLASTVTVAARHDLDDFLVVKAEQAGRETGPAAPPGVNARREAIRAMLVGEVNRRLQALRTGIPGRGTSEDGAPDHGAPDHGAPDQGASDHGASGQGAQPSGIASLGIEATRADVTALLPPSAKFAFDSVLDATQMAEQGLAAARTDAARSAQASGQERDRLLTSARAAADERTGRAQANVAMIVAVGQRMGPGGRPSLLDQLYRERIAGIVKQAGSVDTVDMRGGGRLILPADHP